MPKPVEGYVKPVLRPFEERLSSVFLRAWDSWWKSTGRKTYAYKRARACMVHELIVREARKEFGTGRDVHIIEGPETIYLLFKRLVAARLKKGDHRGLGQNNPTQTSLAFITSAADIHMLPLGLPDVQRVDVTYILNELETRIEQVLVVGRDGRKRLWSYAIHPRAAAEVTPLPIRPPTPPRPDDVVRIPSRKIEKKDAS